MKKGLVINKRSIIEHMPSADIAKLVADFDLFNITDLTNVRNLPLDTLLSLLEPFKSRELMFRVSAPFPHVSSDPNEIHKDNLLDLGDWWDISVKDFKPNHPYSQEFIDYWRMVMKSSEQKPTMDIGAATLFNRHIPQDKHKYYNWLGELITGAKERGMDVSIERCNEPDSDKYLHPNPDSLLKKSEQFQSVCDFVIFAAKLYGIQAYIGGFTSTGIWGGHHWSRMFNEYGALGNPEYDTRVSYSLFPVNEVYTHGYMKTDLEQNNVRPFLEDAMITGWWFSSMPSIMNQLKVAYPTTWQDKIAEKYVEAKQWCELQNMSGLCIFSIEALHNGQQFERVGDSESELLIDVLNDSWDNN